MLLRSIDMCIVESFFASHGPIRHQSPATDPHPIQPFYLLCAWRSWQEFRFYRFETIGFDQTMAHLDQRIIRKNVFTRFPSSTGSNDTTFFSVSSKCALWNHFLQAMGQSEIKVSHLPPIQTSHDSFRAWRCCQRYILALWQFIDFGSNWLGLDPLLIPLRRVHDFFGESASLLPSMDSAAREALRFIDKRSGECFGAVHTLIWLQNHWGSGSRQANSSYHELWRRFWFCQRSMFESWSTFEFDL